MTRELFCTTRRRAVFNETMAHSTWISSPSVKTVCTLSQLSCRTSCSVRLINGDTPGLAKYCGSKQSRKPSSLRSSSASSSIRSCFNQAPKFRQAFTFCTKCFRLNLSCFPSLDSQTAFLQLPQFDLFHSAASVATVRGFPYLNCVVRVNGVVELALSALAFTLFRATLVWAICTRILLQSHLSTLN